MRESSGSPARRRGELGSGATRDEPVQVAESPTSIADTLPVLDSAAERLQCMDQALGARLEAEGRELCQVVTEHILTCF